MGRRRDLVTGMADDPESIRQRGLDAADETLRMLQQRQKEQEQRLHAPQVPAERPERAEWTPPAAEPPTQRTRAVAPRERPQQPGIDWVATRTWVEGLIDGRVGSKTCELIGEANAALGDEAGTLLAGLRTEFKAAIAELRTEFERRLLEAEHRAEVAELTRRLAEAEQRSSAPKPPARPQLVAGGSDGAD